MAADSTAPSAPAPAPRAARRPPCPEPVAPAAQSAGQILKARPPPMVSMTAATARSRVPACPRCRLSAIAGSRCGHLLLLNTRVPSKCMVPLHELLRHVGCHFSRRPESLSGRKFVSRSRTFSASSPACNYPLIRQYARSPRFVPWLTRHHAPERPGHNKVPKVEYIPPTLRLRGRRSRVPYYASDP